MYTDDDERRHADTAVEAWWWWGWTPAADIGWFVGLELRGSTVDYWAGLVRAGERYLYVDELDSTSLRGGLEIKPPEMWADHVCDVPLRQWSLGNEAHGVLLDDPFDAVGRAYGERNPVAFDIEWYAAGPVDGIAHGYRQRGEFDAAIEVEGGVLRVEGAADRVHVWGTPYLPAALAMPDGDDLLWGPYRRRDQLAVHQVLTRDGWIGRTVPRR